MSRTLVLGDPHGNIKGMLQCFERSKFDYEKDTLIVLGDICDGFPYVKQVIDELLKVKDCLIVLGNHDAWAMEWYDREDPYHNATPDRWWYDQGGRATMESYDNKAMPKEHLKFLQSNYPYIVDKKNNLYVHGGINPSKPAQDQSLDTLTWDRDLIRVARHKHSQKPKYKYGGYNKIFIGHTTTQSYGTTKPLFFCNVINLDTGAGWSGPMTIMDRDTLEYWQSDLPKDLYDIQGRS